MRSNIEPPDQIWLLPDTHVTSVMNGQRIQAARRFIAVPKKCPKSFLPPPLLFPIKISHVPCFIVILYSVDLGINVNN